MAEVNKLLIFLASPGDVKSERRHVDKVVEELNRTIAPKMNLVLDVIRWEEDTFPGYGADAQALINRQIAEMANYSLFVGIMWNRLGTPTPRAESGTVEEFERAAAAFALHRQPAIWSTSPGCLGSALQSAGRDHEPDDLGGWPEAGRELAVRPREVRQRAEGRGQVDPLPEMRPRRASVTPMTASVMRWFLSEMCWPGSGISQPCSQPA